MFKKPDLKASRNRLKKYNVQTKEFFNDFRNKYPEYKHLKDTELRKKLRLINEWIIEEILNTRDGVELPQGIGYMFIGSCPKKTSPNPDMQKSYIYNQVVNNKNYESDEYLAKIFYTNFETKYRFKFHNTWGFSACRKFKRGVKPVYIENYTKYLKVDNFKKISSVFRKNIIRDLKNKEDELLLQTYNDLDI